MINDDLDNRLLHALRSFPSADAGDDLAERAAAIATAREQAAAALRAQFAGHRRRISLLNLAAILVIAILAAGVLSRIPWHDWLAAPEPVALIEDADPAAIELPDEAALLLICGGLLLAALVCVTVNPPQRHTLPGQNWAT